MSIEVNSFIDLGLKIDETNNNPKNILLLGNTKGFFGSCSEDKNILTNSCGDEETIKNNYFWLENEYNVCNSNLYIIGDTDVCNYYHHIISDMASMMGKKPKYKYMDINICAKKKGISEEKEIEKYYVNILKEQQGKRMKFDKIIMNPPYDGNLHLKILEQAISLLKEDGDCINLSPIGLIQKYYTLGNTRILDFSDIFDNEISITKIPIRQAMTIFHLDSLGQDLGIWKIRKSLNKTDISDLGKSLVDHIEIVAKIKNKMKGLPSLKEVQVKYSQINTDYPLKFVYGLTLANHGGFGTSCYAPTSINYETAINPIPGNHTVYVCFESEKKRKNAHTFYTLMGMRFFYKEVGLSDTPYNVVGYMGEMFDREWTDEDFRKYFDITDSEWEEIQETMKPYM